MKWFYISFATDAAFLGATVVSGITSADAFKRATDLGLNPGGEAAIIEVPDEALEKPDTVALKNKLVGPKEMKLMGGHHLGDLDGATQLDLKHRADVVCDHCNPVSVSK